MTKPVPYIYQFSELLILELRHVFQQTNAGELGVKAAIAAWQRAIDEEIEDVAFRAFAIEQFSAIMAAIAQGEDDIVSRQEYIGGDLLEDRGEGSRGAVGCGPTSTKQRRLAPEDDGGRTVPVTDALRAPVESTATRQAIRDE